MSTLPVPPMFAHASVIGSDVPCRPALLLAPGTHLSRFRVLMPAMFGPVGGQDEEGDLAHWSDARAVPDPAGGQRLLMSWHDPAECDELDMTSTIEKVWGVGLIGRASS